MNDLLSSAAWRQVLALYHAEISKEDADLIFWLYHYGSRFPEGPLDPSIRCHGERRWQGTEQFLEILDRARAGDQYAMTTVEETYEGLINRALTDPGVTSNQNYRREKYPGAFMRETRPNPDALSKMAKRMVAASCCAFLQGVTRENARVKERWIPYKDWLGCLTVDDTILTFNYDLVVEMLSPQIGYATKGVFVAGSADDSLGRAKRLPFVYKLHGSVNWHLDGKAQLDRPEWTPSMLAHDKTSRLLPG